MKKRANPAQIAFGDWQTPIALANQVVDLLRKLDFHPKTLLEPTCGKGAFLQASLKAWEEAERFGFEINATYVQAAQETLHSKATIKQQNFFAVDWHQFFQEKHSPYLIIGNPPWVTSAELSTVNAQTVPPKKNHNYSGYDAITGKSNFDISETIIALLLDILQHREFVMALLCKTIVARKIVERISKNNWGLTGKLYQIDVKKHFMATVDAVLFVIHPTKASPTWPYYNKLTAKNPLHFLECHNGQAIADPIAYKQTEHIMGQCIHQWRSGIKHDCAGVMELHQTPSGFRNKAAVEVDIEQKFIYPLLKGADVANKRWPPSKSLLVTQKFVGEKTDRIAREAPKTWTYLKANQQRFKKRKSRIYNNKPPFSIFAVGTYAFAPWKVAIAGLYKRLSFWVIGPYQGKPVVFDDTIYFLSFETQEQAKKAHCALTSPMATRFFNARIFWESKRPITKQVLQSLMLQILYFQEKN